VLLISIFGLGLFKIASRLPQLFLENKKQRLNLKIQNTLEMFSSLLQLFKSIVYLILLVFKKLQSESQFCNFGFSSVLDILFPFPFSVVHFATMI
jgi:hypothetical protein